MCLNLEIHFRIRCPFKSFHLERSPLEEATLSLWKPEGHCFEKVDLNSFRHLKLKSGWGTKNSKNGVLTFSNVWITSKTK